MSDIRKRLRALARNAVVWGIGWGVLGFATTLVLRASGVVDAPVAILDALGIGIKIGIAGGIAGAAFAGFISLVYRGRRLQDISWVKFGLGGAIVTAVGMPALMESLSFFSGGGLVPWHLIRMDVATFAVFGGAAAAMSMKLAQVAARQSEDADVALPGEPASAHQLTSGNLEIPLQQADTVRARR